MHMQALKKFVTLWIADIIFYTACLIWYLGDLRQKKCKLKKKTAVGVKVEEFVLELG